MAARKVSWKQSSAACAPTVPTRKRYTMSRCWSRKTAKGGSAMRSGGAPELVRGALAGRRWPPPLAPEQPHRHEPAESPEKRCQPRPSVCLGHCLGPPFDLLSHTQRARTAAREKVGGGHRQRFAEAPHSPTDA